MNSCGLSFPSTSAIRGPTSYNRLGCLQRYFANTHNANGFSKKSKKMLVVQSSSHSEMSLSLRKSSNVREIGNLRIHSLHDTIELRSDNFHKSISHIIPQVCVPYVRKPSKGCPVYVMLPLDTICVREKQGQMVTELCKEKCLEKSLRKFKEAGVAGIMVDVWWGIVEREKPRQYDFSAYKRLFHMAKKCDLKVQAVMSFHAAGCNVGDTCEIPLPRWVLEVGREDPDIFYTDRQGFRNKECLSLGCDHESLFQGRTPVQMYKDFVCAFADHFSYLFGETMTEITVGLGPAGELRYPSYPEGDGRWAFPGVGEFQCYDKYMLRSLKEAARNAGHPEWGYGGPHDAGHYKSRSSNTAFFNCSQGTFDSAYGRFFLTWYSGMLITHLETVLGEVSKVLNRNGRPRILKNFKNSHNGCTLYEFQPAVTLGAKLAGVHWWFKTRSHAAELTAGYYNTRDRDGYGPIMDVMKKYDTRPSFTCVEMRDCEHPPDSMCSPQGLLKQVIDCAKKRNVPIAGENALQRYDEFAFSRITESAFGEKARSGCLEQITFLRMGGLMFDNWNAFSNFLSRMHGHGHNSNTHSQNQTSSSSTSTLLSHHC